jgi:hypothetical protein
MFQEYNTRSISIEGALFAEAEKNIAGTPFSKIYLAKVKGLFKNIIL